MARQNKNRFIKRENEREIMRNIGGEMGRRQSKSEKTTSSDAPLTLAQPGQPSNIKNTLTAPVADGPGSCLANTQKKGVLMSFKSFNLHPYIESGIEAIGYIVPTPIQIQCIPPVLQRLDVMGLAQTGTGKTAAFVLPILQRLMDKPRKIIRALIIAPTRELAEQIHDHVCQLGRQTRLKSITIYGGVEKRLQIRKLHEGAEIVVACPGRLIDLMDQGAIDLSHIEVLVLDEADRMFDMGFLPDIRTILKRLPSQRQTLLFSATMPDDIRILSQEILRNPLTIKVGDTVPVSTVSHALYLVEQEHKAALLKKILDHTDTESVLIFTRTKHRATRLAREMKKAGFIAASLQGDLPQNKRQAALSGFRDGTYQILVATDIAARGIDVSRISHVINYDMPDTVDAYTHRIGRTGRALKTGDAFTFVTSKDRAFVWNIEKVLGEKIERRTLGEFDYTMSARADKDRHERTQQPEKQRSTKAPEQSLVQLVRTVTPVIQPPSGFRNGSRSLSRKAPVFSSPRLKSRNLGIIR
jgi:ATP-dependent RNA helicase RhlE